MLEVVIDLRSRYSVLSSQNQFIRSVLILLVPHLPSSSDNKRVRWNLPPSAGSAIGTLLSAGPLP